MEQRDNVTVRVAVIRHSRSDEGAPLMGTGEGGDTCDAGRHFRPQTAPVVVHIRWGSGGV